MLIDATHPEETRVVILSGNRLENFDVEVESRKQLKGNIYLATVTRVEPSLQAAFVDYGGNRHGFLAFNEIHPDYYQIPVADREALIAEEAEAQKAAASDEDANGGATKKSAKKGSHAKAAKKADETTAEPDDGERNLETVGGDDTVAEETDRALPLRRKYKIQEVIKRRQVLLIQVVKEERGNKGAALTTYLSLAGRYCVLMPNTARGGGISRKITNGADRKNLRNILNSLDIPEGMAVIVRTAGTNRSKSEIKRDYEYLLRLWSDVRETTLSSTAPSLVYEEGNLIKRSIRDLYSRDINEIIVDGDEAYRMAKDFMRLLIPSHAKRVQPYKDAAMPLLNHYQVEGQLDAMHKPQVQLKSGGYIVINPTEALVSIDVNSGRSTRERNIEQTALKTNLEASEEIALQLRLRDLAGLIVIDYIDMEVPRNNAQVERTLKESMREDRARIQVGRISPFGLLELSRQRLRPSIIETSSEPCPHCEGTGVRRSIESSAVTVLRALEEEGARQRSRELTVHVPTSVALYILNQKRVVLADMEQRYGYSVTLENDDSLIPPNHRIERRKSDSGPEPYARTETVDEGDDAGAEEGPKKRRRRRSRRRKSPADAEATPRTVEDTAAVGEAVSEAVVDAEPEPGELAASDDTDKETAGTEKRRRRGRRGGRRRGRKTTEERAVEAKERPEADDATADQATAEPGTDGATAADGTETADKAAPKKPARRPRTRKRATEEKTTDNKAAPKDAASPEHAPEPEAEPAVDATPAPPPEPEPKTDSPKPEVPEEDGSIQIEVVTTEVSDNGPRRSGWWQRPSN